MARLIQELGLTLCLAMTVQANSPISDPYQHLTAILGQAEDLPWQQTFKQLTALLHGVDKKILKKLIATQAEPDLYDVLFWAITHNDTRFATWLLQQGADPNSRYNNMATPHPLFAVTRASVAATLLDHGADITKKNSFDQSLLHKAIDPCLVHDNTLCTLYVARGLLPEDLVDHGASLWHVLANAARWAPADRVIPRAELLAQLRVPAHIPDPTSGHTPAQKIRQDIKQVGTSSNPFIFGQARTLNRLLAIIRQVLRR